MNETKSDRLIFRGILNILLFTFLLMAALATTASSAELAILYSNDIRGETEPCG